MQKQLKASTTFYDVTRPVFIVGLDTHTGPKLGGAVGGPCFNLQHQQTVGIQPYSLKSKLPWKHSLAY